MRAKRDLVSLFGGLVLAALACGGDPAAEGAISPAELATLVEAGDAPVVLDVRTPEEFARGHLPGAIHIPQGELAERVGELSAHRASEIVVYCERGGRAREAEATLTSAGFTDVRDLTGHMSAWREAGLPVE